MRAALCLCVLLPALARAEADACAAGRATLAESAPRTPEISTDEFRRVLADGHATVLDARPAAEYAVSHVPGAVNVAPKAGVAAAMYVSDVAEVGRLLGGRKDAPLVLYCNGPFCGKSKRLAEELAAAGYTGVRRYQLGIPVWRALGGVTQMEPEGARRVAADDRTAVWLDARPEAEFRRGTLPGARHLPPEATRGGKDNPAMQRAKNDGTLPMDDHNTRVVVFAGTTVDARAAAEAVAREAFHNVAFLAGGYDEVSRALAPPR